MAEKVPYINEMDSEVCLPVEHFTFNGARFEAALHARDTIGPWGRSRYLGKRDVRLCDHDGYETCEACPKVPAWCFELYEGTYR